MNDETHTVLTCNAATTRFGYRCTAILAVLPGPWEVTRRLRKAERARAGCGSIVCRKDGCGAKWEVRAVAAAEMQEVA